MSLVRRGADAPADRFAPLTFGLPEALVGLAAGFVLGSVAVALAAAVLGRAGHLGTFGSDVASLLGLWAFLVAAVLAASLRARRPGAGRVGGEVAGNPPAGQGRARALGMLRRDYGLAFRPWPDLPLGVAVGLASQYGLVWLLELPLEPFVRHLSERISQPATTLAHAASGPSLVLLGVLVCLGSPLVEELYFRGLLLRSVAGRAAGLGPRLGPVVSTAVVAVVFGLAHFEALEFLALAGFGAVLCVLAWRTGRLGPGIVAHVTFNAATFITVARGH